MTVLFILSTHCKTEFRELNCQRTCHALYYLIVLQFMDDESENKLMFMDDESTTHVIQQTQTNTILQ